MHSFQHLKQVLSGFLLLAVLIVAFTRQPAVEAKQVHPSGGGTDVCGNINDSTTWNVDGSPYRLTCSVTVRPGITLTIQSGVVVEETHNIYGHRLTVEGHLEAVGSPDNPIEFTATTTQPGDWGGIWFDGGTGHLKYTELRYGGSDGNINVVSVAEGGQVLIEDSQILDSTGYGIRVAPAALDQATFLNNTFQANTPANGVGINGGIINSDAMLSPQLEGSYLLTGDVTIREDTTLTVEPGVVIQERSIYDRRLTVKGHLEAVGNADNPIEFTATSTEPGNWDGIWFDGGTGHLKYTTVRYGGSDGNINVVSIADGGQVLIEDSQILDSTSYGIRIAPTALEQAIFLNNTFVGNTPTDGVAINGGTINSDATLRPLLETSYLLTGDVTIRQGATLTIEPGVVIEERSIYDRRLIVKGHLEAVGNADNPIEFAAITTGPGNWGGIEFDGGTGHLKYTTVRYGGGDGSINVVSTADGGQVLIENSLIEEGSSDGLHIVSGQVTVDCSTIINNGGDGIQFSISDTPSFSIARSSIESNGGEGIDNDSSVEIDARNTWWGSVSGPGGVGSGTGDEVSENVLFEPWLDAPSTECDEESTPTPTATSTPASNTATPTPTSTPASNTPTPTPTSTAPTNTPTGTPPTNTPSPTSSSDFGVIAMNPNEGTTDQTTNVTITGNGFVAVPSVQLRNTDGSHNLLNISHASATQLLATVPAKLEPGLYDLYVTNPDGQSAVLANAFSVLATEPEILEVRPNHGIADLPNQISLYGFSFAVGATVKLGDTELTTTRINGTLLQAVVPADLEAGSYTVTVTNPAGQQAQLTNGYTVFDSDSNNDLFGYSYELWFSPTVPRAGEQVQMGLFVHRQGGRNPLANVRVRFFRDSENGTVLGDGTIPFIDPPNDVDSTIPLDVTFPEAGTFDIVAVIDPDNEVMEDTLGEMNNVISRTVTIGEPNADQIVPVVNDIVINDGALQTTDKNVSVNIQASDPNPNPSGMQAVNIIEYEYNIGASMWVPVQQSNWLPYETLLNTYPWQLLPSAGMRYLQVRALDNAANISIGHARQLISYEPASDSVAFRQMRVYRYEVAEGQQLEALVEVISGDPDLYVWSSNEAESARVSNQASGNEQVIVPAEEIVPGVYQIEVYGYSDAEYRLQVTVGAPTTEGAITHRLATKSGPKPLPSSPIVPVSSVPDEQQGVPPAAPSSVAHFLYLPAITR